MQFDHSPLQEVCTMGYTVLPPALEFGAAELSALKVVQHHAVFALLPQFIAIWLQAAHKHIHGDLHHVLTTGTLKKNKQRKNR